VNENDRPVTGKNDIRLARQTFGVQSKSKTGSMEQGTHYQFRLRVCGANPPHNLTAPLTAENIRHSLLLVYRAPKPHSIAQKPWASTGM
jgi:hypothetical protein